MTTYRSLRGFVSTTLLSRLITKKIWTNPPLWEGFIRCAKLIAPQSFGALLQLPKEQLREVVEKQPSLKAELREFVMKKGTNKARVAGYLDIFAEDDASTGAGAANASMSAPASPGGSPGPSANGMGSQEPTPASTPLPDPEPLQVDPPTEADAEPPTESQPEAIASS